MINISELIDDPDFAQPNGINVKRTTYNVENHKLVPKERVINVRGIITIDSNSDGVMTPEGERIEEKINVFTYKPLFITGKRNANTTSEFISDTVLFRRNEYTVQEVMHDEQYGFSKAVCHKKRQDVM